MGVNRKFDFRQDWKFWWDFDGTLMGWSFPVGIGFLGGAVLFSGGTLHPSANYKYWKHDLEKLGQEILKNCSMLMTWH